MKKPNIETLFKTEIETAEKYFNMVTIDDEYIVYNNLKTVKEIVNDHIVVKIIDEPIEPIEDIEPNTLAYMSIDEMNPNIYYIRYYMQLKNDVVLTDFLGNLKKSKHYIRNKCKYRMQKIKKILGV